MINRRKKNAIAGILLLITYSSMAQSYVEEALLFSQTRPGGSARIQSIGGAQIALGGDYSSALSNPAGLGMYNRSEFTFTPAVSGYTTKTNYLGNDDKDGKTVLNIPGISIVIHGSKDKGGFLGGSFALTMSRINDFQGATTFQGTNQNTSIVDSYIQTANGATTEQFDEHGGPLYNTTTGLAYYNYLIGAKSILDPPGPEDEYFTDVKGIPTQHAYTETTGRANQWSFSYGANFNDILFLGGGVGITSLKYNSEQIFDESFPASDPVINDLIVTENLKIKGTGFNATVGFIVRPVDFLQVGASFTTPTLYNITDTYNATMDSHWKNFDYYGDGEVILRDESKYTDEVISDYTLTTPLKFSAGVALISKFGFITGDIELANPGQARYSSVDDMYSVGYSFDQENNEIKSLYKNTLNYRIGAEYRYEIFRVRGGFGVQGNSYEKGLDLDNSITNISGGVGIRKQSYFIDLALINSSQKKYYYQPYFVEDENGDVISPVTSIKKSIFTGMITVGFTF
jgi:hypothetical protein